MDFKLLWEPRDLWVGVFLGRIPVETDDGPLPLVTQVYVCFVPCLPLRVTIWHRPSISFEPAGGTTTGGER